jgi:hypothetical protein
VLVFVGASKPWGLDLLEKTNFVDPVTLAVVVVVELEDMLSHFSEVEEFHSGEEGHSDPKVAKIENEIGAVVVVLAKYCPVIVVEKVDELELIVIVAKRDFGQIQNLEKES